MTLRRKLIIIPSLLFLAIGGCGVVKHYQLKGRLNAFRAQLLARGEKMTIAELVPLPPHNETNGAMALWSAAGRLSPMKETPALMCFISPGHARIAWMQEILPSDESTNLWPQIATNIEADRPILGELRAALEYPAIHFDLNYAQGFSLLLPHLMPVKSAAQRLTIASIYDLHEGRFIDAFANLRAATKLAMGYGDEPLLISQLVSIAIKSLVFNATWEALQAPGWTDSQLAELQEAWTSMDSFTHAESAFAMERGMGSMTFASLRNTYNEYKSFSGSSPSYSGNGSATSGTFADLLNDPRAAVRETVIGYTGWKWIWSYDDELVQCKTWQAAIDALRQARLDGYWLDAVKEAKAEAAQIEKGHSKSGSWIEELFDPGTMTNALRRIAASEMQRRLLITAIALKRWQLRHGNLPNDLASLLPEFLLSIPRDPMDGKPLRYRLIPDGTFALYSVGEDSEDNQGDPSPANNETQQTVRSVTSGISARNWTLGRDVLWPMPAPQEAVDTYHSTFRSMKFQRLSAQ